MRRIFLASLVILSAPLGAAEVPSPVRPPASPSSGSIEATSDGQATKSSAQRPVSPSTAAKLSAAVPKFTAPAAEPPPAEAPASPVAVSRPVDRSRSQVVELPEFRVPEPRLNVPDPYRTLTPKGRVELGFQRYPGLRMVPFRWMNARVAVELLEDDLQALRRAEGAELLSLYLIY